MTRAMRRAGSALLVALALVLSACTAVPGPIPSSTPDTSGVEAELRTYYGQTLDWQRCEQDAFDCATVRAPRDWADPSAGEIELAIIRQRATGSERLGSLFTNPGGPGVSGYDFVRNAVSRVATEEVAEVYDIVGFDPRGVSRSAPVTCADDAGLDEFLYGIPEGPRGSAEWEENADAIAEEFAQTCADNSGDLLPFLSTTDAARDLDLLRAVVGDPVLNYVGYSWGAALGARYADLFPERVGRMVLDGPIDPALPGSAVGAQQLAGFERSLEAFLVDCAQQNDCPYAGTAEEMSVDLAALLARLDKRPLEAADGRKLGADTMLTAIIQTLYVPGTWAWLRAALTQAEDGDPTAAFSAADAYNGRSADGYADNAMEAFTAYNCMDYPEESEAALTEAEQAAREAAPLFAEYWLGADACAYWPVAPTGVRDPITADGAAPILVLGATGDPATPYEWAVSVAGQLASGVLVTREGEGHLSYHTGVTCVDEVVDAYLIDGAVPDADVVCG